MDRMKLFFPIVGIFAALQAQATIQYGKEAYPAGAGSLKAMTFSGTVAPPKLVPSETGVQLKLSGTGGAYGVAKRLGTLQSEGEYLFAGTRISNPTHSFVTVELLLYNTADKRVLARSSPIVIRNSDSPAINLGLEYRATQRDVGDLLELRWVQTSTEYPDRSFCIEETEVVGIRPMEVTETFPGGNPARLEPAVFTGDASLPVLEKTTKDHDGGDGQGDGSVAVISMELGGTYGAVWKLGKVEKSKMSLHIETVWLAAGNSYVKVDVQLYNATKETVLARSGEIAVRNLDAPPTVVVLDHRLAKADTGCELEVRWVQTSTEHSSRNFIIDRFSVLENKE